MTGWAAVATIVCLLIVTTVGLNASLWRRHKTLAATRPEWRGDDLEAALRRRGCSADTAGAVHRALAPWCRGGLTPMPGDRLDTPLGIGPDAIEEIVGTIFRALDLPEPTRAAPEHIPDLQTVGDLAAYVDRRRRQLTKP